MTSGKYPCGICKELYRTRGLVIINGTQVCYRCHRGIAKFIDFKNHTFSYRGKNLKQALAKTYEVRGYLDKSNNGVRAVLSMPAILIGHKLKIRLVEKNEN